MSDCNSNAETELEIMWTNQHGTGPKTDDKSSSSTCVSHTLRARWLPMIRTQSSNITRFEMVKRLTLKVLETERETIVISERTAAFTSLPITIRRISEGSETKVRKK